MRKRLISSLFILVLFFCIITNVNAMTGQEGAQWALDRVGQSIDTDGYYGAQCKDFVNSFIQSNWGFTPPGNAINLKDYNYPSGWQKIQNTPDFLPLPGDIAVWAYGSFAEYGHCGIITSANLQTFTSVDQNWVNASDNGSPAALVTHNYNGFWGVIRPPYTSKPTPVNLGDSFYALILHKSSWIPITRDSDNYIRLRKETGAANQIWYFKRQSDGCYTIASTVDGKLLELTAGDTTGKQTSVDGTDWGGNYQRWYIYQNADGYTLQSKHYTNLNLVLDVEDSGTTDGTRILTWEGHGGDNQRFAIYKIDKRTPTLSVTAGTATTDTTFSWNTVYGALYNDLYIYNSSGSEYKKVSAISGNSTKLKLPGGKYTAKVRMYNYYYESYSSTISFTVTNPTYTVSYNANGGSGAPGAQTKTYGTNLTLSSTKPTRSGYTFKNWNTAANGSGTAYNAGATYSANAGVTLYAQWTLNKPTNLTISANKKELYLGDNITFTFSHSGATVASLDIYLNGAVEYVNAMGKTSYTYTPKSAGTYTVYLSATNNAGNVVSSPVTFTVTNPTYTVSYNANGGSGAPDNQTKVYNTNLILSTVKPTRAGYTFKNWNTAANGSGTAYNAGATYTANAGVTLYAQWAKYPRIDCFGNTVSQKDGNINITLDRKHDAPYPMKVIVVQYDSYKKAIDIFTDSANGNDREQYTYSVPIVSGASKASVFVWNESTLEPLAYSKTITIE